MAQQTRIILAGIVLGLFSPLLNAQSPGKEIDTAIAWIQEARRNYTAVRDYQCTLVTREVVQGKMQEESVIDFKFKAPFSVSMKWLSPQASRGQEVTYVHGKNNNKMRAKSNKVGSGKLLGFVSVDVNDPRVLEHSRHTIVEAGIGNLIERSARSLEIDKAVGKTETRLAEFQFNKRACYRIESIHQERNKQFYAYRSVLYLDKDSKLPVRNENYDWPVAGGNPEGQLMEVFSYLDMRFNLGLADRDFEK